MSETKKEEEEEEEEEELIGTKIWEWGTGFFLGGSKTLYMHERLFIFSYFFAHFNYQRDT